MMNFIETSGQYLLFKTVKETSVYLFGVSRIPNGGVSFGVFTLNLNIRKVKTIT